MTSVIFLNYKKERVLKNMLHSLASDLLPSQGSSRMAQTESEMQLYLWKRCIVQYVEGMWQ